MATYEELKELNLDTYMTFVKFENPYINYKYYTEIYNGNKLTSLGEEKANELLREASRDVDTLTFNRIVARGINNLTNFQKLNVAEVICKFAEFKNENEDLLNSFVNSYSIAGVSIDFSKSQNLKKINGVIIPINLYNQLKQTGLTTLNLRY